MTSLSSDENNSTETNRAIRDSVIRKASLRLIPFMGLLYFVAFLDRVNIGFAALSMNEDLGFSATVYGMGAGIFFIGYFLFEVPSNILLEKVGARRWIARIMITWGVISAAMAFVNGPYTFYTLRFLLGLAEAGFFPGMILYLTYWFPAAYRARIVGAFLIAIPLSSVIGAPISTMLLGYQGFGLRGWQWLFIMEGVPSLLLGFVVLFFLTDKPEKANWLTREEKNWLGGVLAEEQKVRENEHKLGLVQALLNARVWLFSLIYFGILIGLYGLGLWLPQIIKGFGALSNIQIGLLTVIPYFFAAIAMYLWGLHSDLTNERVWHVALPAFLGAAGLAASAFFASPTLALMALTVSAIGIYSSLPAFWTLPTAMLSGTAAAGGIALINSVGNLGGYLGPSLVGYLKDKTQNYAYGLLMLAVFIAISGALTVLMGQRQKLKLSSTSTEAG
ncbi:MAG TPA: MFS transporter [Pyrinomonadaceae bacterium]|jgi:D-galactonate transporter